MHANSSTTSSSWAATNQPRSASACADAEAVANSVCCTCFHGHRGKTRRLPSDGPSMWRKAGRAKTQFAAAPTHTGRSRRSTATRSCPSWACTRQRRAEETKGEKRCKLRSRAVLVAWMACLGEPGTARQAVSCHNSPWRAGASSLTRAVLAVCQPAAILRTRLNSPAPPVARAPSARAHHVAYIALLDPLLAFSLQGR